MRILVAGLVAGLTLCAAPAAAASTTPRLALPEPIGRHSVGATAFHLVDEARTDPWRPVSGNRELMVTMWYPTAVPHGASVEYVTAAESEAFLDFQRDQGSPIPEDLPDDVLTGTRTHATAGVPPLPRPGGRPLVLLSPGFTLPRATLTGLATGLASRGYLVAAVDHAYESSGTSFPSGLKTCVACEVGEATAVPPVRAADMSLVLDRLTRNRLVDADRVAMVGHSIGGASAATALAADDRIDAGVNLDGTFFDPLPAAGLRKPFLMLGTQRHRPGGDDESWDTAWARLHGAKYWFTVEDTGHLSFTDTAVLADQMGLTDPAAPLPGTRTTAITRAYVGAFLDRHLRGAGGSLLDGPSERFPEVHPQP
ncbi:MAG: alpha/beta hydrolase [Streptosporangiales bacterium]|nr:alpha/beta hydrolase [Streptosporangiales bacterium]